MTAAHASQTLTTRTRVLVDQLAEIVDRLDNLATDAGHPPMLDDVARDVRLAVDRLDALLAMGGIGRTVIELTFDPDDDGPDTGWAATWAASGARLSQWQATRHEAAAEAVRYGLTRRHSGQGAGRRTTWTRP